MLGGWGWGRRRPCSSSSLLSCLCHASATTLHPTKRAIPPIHPAFLRLAPTGAPRSPLPAPRSPQASARSSAWPLCWAALTRRSTSRSACGQRPRTAQRRGGAGRGAAACVCLDGLWTHPQLQPQPQSWRQPAVLTLYSLVGPPLLFFPPTPPAQQAREPDARGDMHHALPPPPVPSFLYLPPPPRCPSAWCTGAAWPSWTAPTQCCSTGEGEGGGVGLGVEGLGSGLATPGAGEAFPTGSRVRMLLVGGRTLWH